MRGEDGPFRIVLADEWVPPLPRINTGVHKVDLHCGDDEPYTETMRENRRTGGHGIEFRCLLLDMGDHRI